MNRAYWRRLPVLALMLVAVAIGCQGDPSGPQVLTEEERLERQLEQAGLTECLAEFQRMRASLAGLPRDQILLELRRIVRLCFAPSGVSTTLDVAARTTGLDRDADGYTVQISGQPDRALGINGSERFEGLPPGDVQVTLTGIAENCVFLGDNPRTVAVTPGVAEGTTFEVECFSSESAGAIVGFGEQIDALFFDPVLRQAARFALEQIAIDVDTGDDAAARTGALQFIDFLTDRYALGGLTDPNDGAPPTTEEAVVGLAIDVAEFAEIGTPPLTEAALSDDAAVGLVGAGGGTVVTGNGHSGVSFPAGALPGPTLVIISRLPEEGAPADHDGPLPTTLDQYPLFYDISTFPEVGELGAEAVVGICVVDPPDPFAPDPAIVGRLRLAHPSPGDPTTIEILPLADASFLDCTGAVSGPATSAGATASRNLRLTSPGKLGGAILSFSPFGAVDPGEQTLVLLTAMSCSQESSLRSESADILSSIQFVNETSQTINIFWRNYNGDRVYYQTLGPRESYVQGTFLTHPWVVTDASGRCLATYLPVAQAGQAVIAAPLPVARGPAVRIDAPGNGTETVAATIVVSGRVDDPTAQAQISVTSAEVAEPRFTSALQIDVQGNFNIQVPLFDGLNLITVTASNAAQELGSAGTSVTRTAVEEGPLVTLTWDNTANMDLHLLRGQSTAFFDQVDDCFYLNCLSTDATRRPDWGPVGPIGNPRLDRNDTDGFGPENISLDVVESSAFYRVGVHALSGSGTISGTINFENQTIRCGPFFLPSGQTTILAVFSQGRGAICGFGPGTPGADRGVRLQGAMKAPPAGQSP